MFTPLKQHTHHVFNALDTGVAIWFAPSDFWAFAHLEQPHASLKLSDEYRIFTVLESCLFAVTSVPKIGLNNGFKSFR